MNADARPTDRRPATFDELAALLRQEMPSLTPSHRLLAELVLADPEGIAFMTITELAATVRVNESTVVRFAARLGLEGYPALSRVCRAKLRDEAQLLRRFAGVEEAAGDATRDPLELAASFDHANITRTLARVDRATWDGAVAALADAPRVHVLGLRKCFSAAFLLGYLLRMVRDEVTTLAAGVGTLLDDVRRIQAGDCFVAISIHRYAADAVRALHRAQQVGATTVVLTDNPSSPLVDGTDHVFYVDTSGVAVMRSMTAFVALVQTMANAVAAARGTAARATLAREEELLDQFVAYWEPPAPRHGRRDRRDATAETRIRRT